MEVVLRMLLVVGDPLNYLPTGESPLGPSASTATILVKDLWDVRRV